MKSLAIRQVVETTNLLPVIAWWGVNILDSLTTDVIINMGGRELNAVYYLSSSMEAVFISKWICVAGLAALFWKLRLTNVLWAFTAPLVICVANNSFQILRGV